MSYRIVLTLPNHCDARDAFELLDEVERRLAPHSAHVELNGVRVDGNVDDSGAFDDSTPLAFFIETKSATDNASKQLDALHVRHSVQHWQDSTYRIDVDSKDEALVAKVLR